MGAIDELQITVPMTSALLSDGDLRNLQGKRLQERYRLTRLIDWGGFGAVYEAVDEKFDDRIVAVKVAAAAASERAFAKEAKLAHKFEHPNVVKVHDYGVDSGLSFIVMELLSGVRFDTLLERYRGQLPHDMLCKFVREIGSALRKGHRNGLVHRDLKPKNVLLVEDGAGDDDRPRQRFVLLDFGIASQIDASNSLKNLTMDGAGTPEYMSPEQVQAQPVTACSDIYSFGVILYQLLAGRVPFPLPDQSHLAVAQCLTAIVKEPPPRFSDIAASRMIDGRIEELILQSLEKDPKKRPESMQDVRDRFLAVYAPEMAGNTLDTIDRGETIHPGVARGGTSTDNAAGTETRASWHGRTVRSVGPPKRGTPWGLFAVLLLVGGAIAAFFVVPRGGSQEPGFEIKVLPEELSITAGESQTLFVEFQRTQFEDEIDVRVGPPPDDVTIELAEGSESSDTRTYTVNVHLNAPPTTTELLVEARGGDLQRSRTVPLRVKSVPGWLPDTPEGFEESGPKKRAAGRIYYERIRRQIPGELPVDFVLVDEPGEVPFYIMANKAWNGLFAAFAEEVADFRDPLRAKEDPGWDLEQARANPLLPATNLTVVEANRFGRWLAGKYADLPTHDEWDIAAGYRRIRHDPADQEFLLFTNASAAAVGGKRLPVDRVSADKSVYGCRDMAGNGYEWTRSIFYNQGRELDEGVPIEDVSPLFGDIDSVIYRGQSFAAPEPLTFADLTRQITKEPRMNPISLSSEDIGFRIVIRPPAVRSSD